MKRRKAKRSRYQSRRQLRYNLRHGGEARGNSVDRRRRKKWLLKHFGDGTTTRCVHCNKKIDYDTLTADRIIPGCKGGRYTHDNIQPSCLKCNNDRHIRECQLEPSLQSAMFSAMVAAGKTKTKASNPRRLRYKTVKFRRGILRGYIQHRSQRKRVA